LILIHHKIISLIYLNFQLWLGYLL